MRKPDILTGIRVPLAIAFFLVEHAGIRFLILLVVGVTDVADGVWARRIGGSRVGTVLDPVADKLFMASAFWVVLRSNLISPIEILGVLLRDVVAAGSFLWTVVLRRPKTLPARAGGKAVTVCQGLTLVAFLAGSDLLRPLAWATAAISLYAIADYVQWGLERGRGADGEGSAV
ncbi:MAG: CDP-alcohol phosphatidyltransferase family protein [Gemmatimonadales bacterium]